MWTGCSTPAPRHQAFRRRVGLHAEVKDALGGVRQQLPGMLEQHAELGLGMRRTDVLQDPLTAPDVLGNLYCYRRAEGKPDREIRRCLKRYLARRLYRHLNAAAAEKAS